VYVFLIMNHDYTVQFINVTIL